MIRDQCPEESTRIAEFADGHATQQFRQCREQASRRSDDQRCGARVADPRRRVPKGFRCFLCKELRVCVFAWSRTAGRAAARHRVHEGSDSPPNDRFHPELEEARETKPIADALGFSEILLRFPCGFREGKGVPPFRSSPAGFASLQESSTSSRLRWRGTKGHQTILN